DLYYTVTANVRTWDQTGDTGVAEVLRSAMTQQTYLKLLVICGYYDVATPFDGIEHTVNHMHLEPPIRKNVSFTYYEAGHMMYIDEKEHHKLHKDIDDFINAGGKSDCQSLGHELNEDVAFAGAQRFLDANLARALGHRDQHDVHEANAADA